MGFFGSKVKKTVDHVTKMLHSGASGLVRQKMNENLIYRTQTIDGYSTPALIHNNNYFFVNLKVFADGMVYCWDLVDLDGFRQKLKKGWVVTDVPKGKPISIHGLGSWTVADGHWLHNTESLYDHVVDLARKLNPELRLPPENSNGRKKKKCKHIRNPARHPPFRRSDPDVRHSPRIKGESLSVFFRESDGVYLADLRVFSDEIIQISRLPEPKSFNIDEIRSLIEDEILLTKVPDEQKISIHGFGEFTTRGERWNVEISALEKDIYDRIDSLNGRPNSIARCKSFYKKYCEAPSEELRQELKEAYEQIPEHNKMYVGDMDTKDIPVRMIIYGDEEIEGWSHRAVARKLGRKELPTITVPKVNDNK